VTTWQRVQPADIAVGDVIAPPQGGESRRVAYLEKRPGAVWVYWEGHKGQPTINRMARLPYDGAKWLRKVRP
jgi:hypothetical protein